MKTKTLLLSLILGLSINFAQGQVYNLNPDPNGDPWWSGGVPSYTTETLNYIWNYPFIARESFITPSYSVDNSSNNYWRPVFAQEHGSCAQASGIGYVLTYELAWLRGSSAIDSVNWYPTHFTYNFLNNGDPGYGSYVFEGWEIVKENGCPNVLDYGGDMCINKDSTNWMTEYNKYKNALENKLDSIYKIDFSEPEEGLTVLKQWLYNHNKDTCNNGGLASFLTNMNAIHSYSELPSGTPEAGKRIVSTWFNPFGDNHYLTVVGYNDSVRWDFNGDLSYTNNIDTSNDDTVTMLDWEIGALKVANSYGAGYQDSGFVYWPYRFLAGDPLYDSIMWIIKVKEETNTPDLVLKVKLTHTKRNKLRIGVESGTNSESTPTIQEVNYYQALDRSGGEYPLLGYENNEPLEITFDYGYFYDLDSVGKIFLNIYEKFQGGGGYLNSFSLVDYRWDEIFELNSGYINDTIITHYNWFSINYDLIVPGDNQLITTTDTLFSDMVSRFNPTVDSNSTLLVEQGVSIDMYNSDITINSGSTLTLEDSVTITAKRDTCRIIINGELNIGKHINFIAEDSALLEISINNENFISDFDSVYFERCKIFHFGKELNINDCEFVDCQRIYSSSGKVTIDKSDLTKTGIHIFNSEESDFLSTISNCELNTENTGTLPGIYLQGCLRFNIFNNTINGYFTGIDIRFSGTDEYTDKKVYDNTIDSCYFNGISTYYSTLLIEGNNIQNNLRGISFFNNSTTEVMGDEGASSYEESQQISNNSSYELYSSSGSFPWSIQYNIIHESDNASTKDPIVYTEINPSQLIPDTFDIRYNCWDSNFDSINDLSPSYPFYKLKPKVCPGKKSATAQLGEHLYRTGLDQFAIAQYSEAQNTFQQVVEQYPGSAYSLSAMKSMFDVEEFVDNDYFALQDYYLTNTTIISDSSMKTLGIFLANRCNLSLGQWQNAINHYENIIDNPPTPDDSVFAIIDLGYTYLLMQNSSGRYVAMGRMTEHIPDSDQDFEAKSTKLLTLLPIAKSSIQENNDETLSNAVCENRLLLSKPNPTSGVTTVEFSLSAQGNVIIGILNNLGSRLKFAEIAGKEGVNSIELNLSDLPSGIYYYTLEMNGKIVDIQKMVVVK